MNNQDIWVLLDFRGLMLHSYHAGVDKDATKDSEGNKLNTPAHTLYNFVDRYLVPITNLVPLNKIIAVHDAGNDYRKAVFPAYKANRKDKTKEQKASVDASHKAVKTLLQSLGILQTYVTGTEADDVIAYLNQKLPGHKMIYTVDGDLIAMVSPTTTVFLKGEPRETFGECEVLPRHLPLYKSLCGDSSDGYLGVKGFGPAAWTKLLEEYGDDGLMELSAMAEAGNFGAINDVISTQPGQHKLLEKIAAALPEWITGWKLARLNPDLVGAKVGKDFRLLRWDKRLPSIDRLSNLARDTGALLIVKDLEHLFPNQYLITRSDMDQAALTEAETLFRKSRFISLDLETWAERNENFIKAGGEEYVDVLGSKVTGMGITCGDNHEHTFYFTFDHADSENNLDKKYLPELLNRIPKGMPMVIQNINFERTVILNEFGLDLYIDHPVYDTQLMASHVDEMESAGLKDSSKRYMNYDQIHYRDVVPAGKTMRDITSETVFKYGADDPLVTAHLFDFYYVIMCLEGTWEFVRDYEFNAVPVLSDGYLAGVSIDFAECERQRAEDQLAYDTAITNIRNELREHVTTDYVNTLTSTWEKECKIFGELEYNWLKDYNESRGTDVEEDDIEEDRKASDLIDSIRLLKSRHMRYADWVPDPDVPRTFTLSNFNEMAKLLGLPLLEGSATDANNRMTWLSSLPTVIPGKDASKFISLVAELRAIKSVSTTVEYDALREFCSPLLPEKVEKKKTGKGTELNLDSPKQNQHLLYGMLALPIKLRNPIVSKSRLDRGIKVGAVQANEEAILDAIANGHAPEGSWKRVVLDNLMTAKKAHTRIKFFYSKFPLWEHPSDGLIHPQFRQCGTETRRPSGSAPNLLQLSKKGDGVKVRRCIIPNQKLGHNLVVSADFDAQELRVLAGLSRDPVLMSCYVGDNLSDLHSMTASVMAGVTYDEFIAIRKDKDHPLHKKYDDVRKDAKNVNFGSSYGIGAAKLSRKLLCHPDVAKQYLDAKKSLYVRQEQWRAELIQEVRHNGFVKTVYGSVKHLFNKLNSSDEGLVAYYERATVNYMIQATCADILKRVMANLYKAGTFQRTGAVLIAPLYDEIVASVHSDNAVTFMMELHTEMTREIEAIAPIPMLANPAVGINFGDQKDILADANQKLTPELVQATIDKVLKIERKEAA